MEDALTPAPPVAELLAALSEPSAYRHAPASVEVIQTHVSCVFLAGTLAYKLKKPVDLGFVDFTTCEARRVACEDEVRLNQALAPGVYLRVASITREADGSLRVDGAGEPVEPVVEMRRLPAERMLDRLLDAGEVDNALIETLARLLARFHSAAPTGPGVDEHGTPEAIEFNIRENAEQTERFALERGRPGLRTLSPVLHRFLSRRAFAFLAARPELLERRVATGRVRDGHGDLHAGNVCVLPEGILVYDRIEFAPRFRCGDVAAELAFLAMDLDARGYRGFSGYLARRYAELADDPELAELLPFYKAYRAVVRGKVLSLTAADPLLAPAGRETHRLAAMRSFHLAASYDLPPALVLTCGLPATGKSTVARAVAAPFEAVVLRSDVRRKQLVGLRPTERAAAPFREGIYGESLTARTYAALLEAAARALAEGRTVVVDASFSRVEQRRPFAALAASSGVPLAVLDVGVPGEVAAARLAARACDEREVSDADLDVYRELRERFEPPDELPASQVVRIDGREPGEEAAAAAIDLLAGLSAGA